MFLQKQNISNTKHLLKKSHPIENNNIELKKIYNKIHKQMNNSKWYTEQIGNQCWNISTCNHSEQIQGNLICPHCISHWLSHIKHSFCTYINQYISKHEHTHVLTLALTTLWHTDTLTDRQRTLITRCKLAVDGPRY